jgi:hypothetical protein
LRMKYVKSCIPFRCHQSIIKATNQTSIYWLTSIFSLTFVSQLRACAVWMTLRSKDKPRRRSKKSKSCMPEVTILSPKSFLGFQV